LAKQKFEKAEEYSNHAIAGRSVDLTTQPLSKRALSAIVDQAKTSNLIKFGIKDVELYTFILSSLILAVVTLQMWTQVFVDTSTDSYSGLWYISAFLIGYGSQSLVGQAIEGLKTKLSS
jgi:hypothetical protein